jgi:hypothetical protein
MRAYLFIVALLAVILTSGFSQKRQLYIPPTRIPTPSEIGTPTPTPAAPIPLVGLQVQPIDQLISAGNKMNNGNTDYGKRNSVVASTAMVFGYLKSQGVLNASDSTDYLAIRDVLRYQGKNAFPWNDLEVQALIDLTPQLTRDKLKANGAWIAPERFEETVSNELKANRPVIAALPNWSVLPGHSESAAAGASIVIHGLQTGKLFYIDPWGGARQEILVADYIKTALWSNQALFILTFDLAQTK